MKIQVAFVIISIALAVSQSSNAQSGAPTGTLVDPSSANGVESNPTTFENVQPLLGATPTPPKHPKPPKVSKHKPAPMKMETKSFASPPDTMEKETKPPEPKESH